MDAYASLLSVVSNTPTPGAPITLDPEVLNTGTSKIVATMRMYQDPTFSIPASATVPMPVTVTRFYVEVSTKFTRNRITISDCNSSDTEAGLNDTYVIRPRMNYCDNSTFNTLSERAPNGVTHMDRLSKSRTRTGLFLKNSRAPWTCSCRVHSCAVCMQCKTLPPSGQHDVPPSTSPTTHLPPCAPFHRRIYYHTGRWGDSMPRWKVGWS